VIHLHHVLIKFKGQGHRSKFKSRWTCTLLATSGEWH